MRTNRTTPTAIVSAILVVAGIAAGCQIQTNRFALCASLQVQGGDATCWVKGELQPVQLVAPGMLFVNHAVSLDAVLDELKGTVSDLHDGTEFENEVARFVLRCTPAQNRKCVWRLISHPKQPGAAVLMPQLKEAVEWAVVNGSGSVKLVLLEQHRIDGPALAVTIGPELTIEWSDERADFQP